MSIALETVDLFYRLICSKSVDDNAAALDVLSDNVRWHAAHPVNDLKGKDPFMSDYWNPIKSALPDVERQPFIAFEDDYNGRTWVCSMGYLVGSFMNDLFGIPASKEALFLRYGEFICVEDGKITEAYIIPDFLDAMQQVGVFPIRHSLGKMDSVLPPSTQDGLSIPDHAIAEGRKTQKLVMDMLHGLGRYDGKSLMSMDMEKYWHNGFMWYGPAGIGTTRDFYGFREYHQGPFLLGCPDRSVDEKFTFMGKGNYAAIGGWPHMHATHTGPNWLGLNPTGKAFELRVFDFWLRQGDKLKENWVFIDILHILDQLGRDVFDEIKRDCDD
ncbi:ester cyclase [Temperatibacter marinus]|uniref:Ester cyclase n=1 Tax=Temperatibacter marinus TaxID=1456591 RepID=A0AA52H9B8_9PROT|nr:ester cyclase [Temperatibacter marinus]WND03021.1 ester cyclase [Temperatibacter marinus]